jgi:hypothetical protein
MTIRRIFCVALNIGEVPFLQTSVSAFTYREWQWELPILLVTLNRGGVLHLYLKSVGNLRVDFSSGEPRSQLCAA